MTPTPEQFRSGQEETGVPIAEQPIDKPSSKEEKEPLLTEMELAFQMDIIAAYGRNQGLEFGTPEVPALDMDTATDLLVKHGAELRSLLVQARKDEQLARELKDFAGTKDLGGKLPECILEIFGETTLH